MIFFICTQPPKWKPQIFREISNQCRNLFKLLKAIEIHDAYATIKWIRRANHELTQLPYSQKWAYVRGKKRTICLISESLSFGHSIVLIAYLSRWLWFLSFLVDSSFFSSENYDVLNRKERKIRKLMWIPVNGMCWYDDSVVQLHLMSDGKKSMSNDPLIISAKDDNLES